MAPIETWCRRSGGKMKQPQKILLVGKVLLVGMFVVLIQCAVAITAQATPTPTPVSITSPAAGSVVSGVVTFTCTNPGGTARLYIDDVFVASSTYSWNTTKFTNGSHYLLCNGYQNTVLVGSTAENVTVRNGASTPTPKAPTPTPTPTLPLRRCRHRSLRPSRRLQRQLRRQPTAFAVHRTEQA